MCFRAHPIPHLYRPAPETCREKLPGPAHLLACTCLQTHQGWQLSQVRSLPSLVPRVEGGWSPDVPAWGGSAKGLGHSPSMALPVASSSVPRSTGTPSSPTACPACRPLFLSSPPSLSSHPASYPQAPAPLTPVSRKIRTGAREMVRHQGPGWPTAVLTAILNRAGRPRTTLPGPSTAGEGLTPGACRAGHTQPPLSPVLERGVGKFEWLEKDAGSPCLLLTGRLPCNLDKNPEVKMLPIPPRGSRAPAAARREAGGGWAGDAGRHSTSATARPAEEEGSRRARLRTTVVEGRTDAARPRTQPQIPLAGALRIPRPGLSGPPHRVGGSAWALMILLQMALPGGSPLLAWSQE